MNPYHDNPAAKLTARLIALLAAALLLTAPLWAGQGLLFVLGMAVIQGAFALTWNMLYGYMGMATFGHAAFYAIGAYTVGAVIKKGLAVHYLLAMGIAGAIGAVVAVLVGLMVLRRSSGIYLAILTLALSELLYQGITRTPWLGNDDGFSSLQRPTIDLGVFEISLRDGFNMYYFVLLVAFIIGAIIWRLVHSRFGRVLRAIKQDPERVSFVGVNIFRVRLTAFTLSGALAAIVGTLHTPWLQLVTPDVANWVNSTAPLLNTLVGGATSFWGPFVGAFVFSGVNQLTRNMIGVSEVTMGVILLVIILLAPNGIAGLWNGLVGRLTRKKTEPQAGGTHGAH